MASICLHTNCKLGGLKYRYITYKKFGYQFVGRAVTGLTILKQMFAMPPPYFDILSCPNDMKGVLKDKLNVRDIGRPGFV